MIDFGFASEAKAHSEAMRGVVGSPSYMAPELWESPTYDSAIDMWAIGVTVFILLSAKRPFHHRDMEKKKKIICHSKLHFPPKAWKHRSDESKDFISKLLEKDPAHRLSATAARHHPWITKHTRVHRHKMRTTTGILPESDAVEVDAALLKITSEQLMVKNLSNFAEKGELAKLALEVVAFSTAPSSINGLRELFTEMDADGTGTISLLEFQECMGSVTDLETAQIGKLFHAIDVSGSGELEYTEFIAAMLAAHGQSDGTVRQTFSFLDSDGDGRITLTDVATALNMGDHSTASQAEMATLLSKDIGPEGIDFTAFQSLMDGKAAQGVVTEIVTRASVSESRLSSLDA